MDKNSCYFLRCDKYPAKETNPAFSSPSGKGSSACTASRVSFWTKALAYSSPSRET